jgi:hypothetical protein
MGENEGDRENPYGTAQSSAYTLSMDAILLRAASTRFGRVALHLIAAASDHAWRFHWAGIAREFKGS